MLMAKDGPPRGDSFVTDYVFYDDRFTKARQLACTLANAGKLMPVQGDMTGIWNAGLRQGCMRSPLLMQGVTTGSFYFCLHGMLAPMTNMQAQIRRINTDLFLWKIQSSSYT